MKPYQTKDQVLRSCAVLLSTLAVLTALSAAQDVAAPLLMAIVIGIVFAPTVDRIDALGLPRWMIVLCFMMVLFLAVASLAYVLEPYVWNLIYSLPAIKWELRSVINDYRALISGVDQVNREMAEAFSGNGSAGSSEAKPSTIPTLTDALFLAPQIFVQILIFLGGVFFFLLTRDEIYRTIARMIGNREATEVMLQRFCNAENIVARFFLTITLINVALGVSLAAFLMLLGMPGAVVWGIFACLMNFILYLGPLLVATSLLLGGTLVFDGALSFAPVAIFLTINMLEAQFVTSGLVGRNVAINPLIVFASLCFWLWLWGPLGGIVAIPITLIVVKIFDVLGEKPLPEASMDERQTAA